MISLRPVEIEDLDLLYDIENAHEEWTASESNVPYSRFALTKYIADTQLDIYADRQLRLIIEADGVPVGIADLFDFEPLHDRAAVGIVVAEAYRGRGIAAEALRLLDDYAFRRLHLHQLYAHVARSNAASLALFRAAGYTAAATLTDWLRRPDGYEDAVVFQKRAGR